MTPSFRIMPLPLAPAVTSTIRAGESVTLRHCLMQAPVRFDFLVVAPHATALELIALERDMERIPREHWLNAPGSIPFHRVDAMRWATPRLIIMTAETVIATFRNPTDRTIDAVAVSAIAVAVDAVVPEIASA